MSPALSRPTDAAPPRRSFALTRYFSFTALLGIAAVTAALIWAWHETAMSRMVEHETRANTDLTQAFANAVWPDYRGFVMQPGARTREQLLAAPEQRPLRDEVLEHMHGLQIQKVKIYSVDGLTVFSTDPKQLGESKSGNAGFQQARAGTPASQITYRERFDAFEGTISHRNLMATYVPVRAAQGGAIEGVVEVYSDVTPLIHAEQRMLWQAVATVLVLLGLLYLFLLLVVRKADRIIAAHDAEALRREDQVRHLAFNDLLTGLPNRAAFLQRWAETVALAARHQRRCALMFVDLDRFKAVNDRLGHAAGDALLQTVSLRMQASLRDCDLMFRMGGDEFTVILTELTGADDASAVARRLQLAVCEPVLLEGEAVAVGASIGITMFPSDGDSAEALLRHADAAMYAAKQGGRGQAVFHAG